MLIYMNSDIYCPTITFPPLDILAYLAQKVLKQKWLIDSLMLYFPFKDLTVWLLMATSTCNGETKGLRVYPACTIYFTYVATPAIPRDLEGGERGRGLTRRTTQVVAFFPASNSLLMIYSYGFLQLTFQTFPIQYVKRSLLHKGNYIVNRS